jgi:hypothetical protein
VPYVDRWWGYATGTLPRCHRGRWALRCRGWPLPAEREMPTQPPMRSKPRTSESASTTSASSGSENSGNVRPRSRGELRRATCLRSPGFAHSCAPSRPKCDTSTTSSTGSTGASRPLGQAAATRAVLVLGAGRRHGTRRISCDRATGWNIRRAGTVRRWRAELGLCRLMQGYAAGWTSDSPSVTPATDVGMQTAHSTPSNVGYPHAGQIAMRSPAGEVLMATAAPFIRVPQRVPTRWPV